MNQLTFVSAPDASHDKAYITFQFNDDSSPSTHIHAFVKKIKSPDTNGMPYFVALENRTLSVYDSETNTTTATFFPIDDLKKAIGSEEDYPTPDQYLIGPLSYTQTNTLLNVFRSAAAIKHFQHIQKMDRTTLKESLPTEPSWNRLLTGIQGKIKSSLNL